MVRNLYTRKGKEGTSVRSFTDIQGNPFLPSLCLEYGNTTVGHQEGVPLGEEEESYLRARHLTESRPLVHSQTTVGRRTVKNYKKVLICLIR